ncbi:MAG: 16S rRNA (uracil(1498)-N(3))-methyltransferase [Ignavibacteriaceae bacterium]
METTLNKYLTGVQMYYSTSVNIGKNEIIVEGDECKHILAVMRHSIGDEIFLTNGEGSIFSSQISGISNKEITATIQKEYKYNNKNKNIYFCMPMLKNPDRFEFALEKCIEFGITEFIIYRAKNSLTKSFKQERWEKISLAAMKQSLRAFIPNIKCIDDLEKLKYESGNKILLDQSAESNFCSDIFHANEKNYVIFGPEGGFHKDEVAHFDHENFFSLTDNRLRSETSIILAAGLISLER